MGLTGKKIVIGITAGISAYKIPFLVRLLKKEGAEVQVIMTSSARDFVSPLTLSTLSGKPVLSTPFDSQTGSWNSHVELGRWADIMLFAPLTANTMGKMAHAIADNFLVTTYIAAKCPVLFAPAMDLDMFKHPANQKNMEILQSYGNILIAPREGELASGLCGAGRMEEPEAILDILKDTLKKKDSLSGRQVLVTAGPTYERIDPVRFIGNFSSGKMGFALAEAFEKMGAAVTLITGPTSLPTPPGNITRVDIESADEMFQQVKAYFPLSDILMMSAAVADYKPASRQKEKMKKEEIKSQLKMVKTIDILETIAKMKKPRQIVGGFALETTNEQENAQKKLQQKNLDFIVLNSLKDKGAGFGGDTNKVCFISKDTLQRSSLKSKKEIAQDIVQYTVSMMQN
ncbi:MAG: bifunctional phosphopantothenoylcysteine decarboxylase/phosphopantothenate--cysteine ligase CoaBC [Bacteroidales bacterium]